MTLMKQLIDDSIDLMLVGSKDMMQLRPSTTTRINTCLRTTSHAMAVILCHASYAAPVLSERKSTRFCQADIVACHGVSEGTCRQHKNI